MPQVAIAGLGAWAGGAIGGSILGVSMSSIGWMAGSMLGSALFAKGQHTSQPQMADLRVQSSALGQVIPRGYGTFRHAGFVVFSTDRRPVKNVQEAGKGGAKSTNTYWTYTLDMAIDLGFGPGDLLQVFMNGKLIYDVSSGQSAASVIASGTSSAGFKFYRGTEDQMPDPTIEATRGVGNVSAYRGRMLAVFTNMDLGTNGAFPQFEFVTSRNLTGQQERIVYTDVPYVSNTAVCGFLEATDGWHVTQFRPSTYQIRMSVWRIGPGYETKFTDYNFDYAIPQTVFWWAPVNCPGARPQMVKSEYKIGGGGTVDVLDLQTGATTRILDWIGGGDPFYTLTNGVTAARDPASGAYAMALMNDNSGSYTRAARVSVICDQVETLCPLVPSGFLSAVAALDHSVYVLNMQTDGKVHLLRYEPVGGVIAGGVPMVLADDIAGPSYGSATGISPAAGYWGLRVTAAGIEAWIRIGTVASLYRIDSSWHLITNQAAPEGEKISSNPTLFYTTDDYLIIGPSTGFGTPLKNRYSLIRYAALSVADVSVADIILGEHALAGQDAAQVDVSDLAALQVHGYPIGRMASARATIEPILAAYFIDSYDAGSKRKYVRRADQPVAAWISYDELGAVEAGAEPAEPFPLVHANSDEWPRSLTVNFIDKTNDYQPGSQPARRLTVESGSDEVFEMAIATTPDHAATVAHVQLYNRWAERDSRKASVLRQYAFLDPSDHIMVEYPRGTWSRWVIAKMTDTGAVISLDQLIPVDPALYDQIVSGHASNGSQVVAALPPPTRSLRLDIPILRDSDDNPGIYVPMAGVGPNWPGGALWVGPDDTSLSMRGQVEQEAIIGVAETVLGNWTRGTFDYSSTVIVQIRADQELNSTTRQDLYDRQANAILIGREILSFQDATDLGGGRWLLTGFLRGQRGTEQHRGTHAIGERFVFLQVEGMLRPGFEVSDLGQPRNFRAVTVGRPLETALSETDVNTGVGLMPFSPVNLRRTRASDGAITATWDRRSRKSQNLATGAIPVGEASEAYELVIYTNSGRTVERRVIPSSTPTATYTAAMQTTDGVTPGAVAYATVFQISDSVGRGFPLQGTL